MYRFFSFLSLFAYITPFFHALAALTSQEIISTYCETNQYDFEVETIYDSQNRLSLLEIPSIGKIQYVYNEEVLSEVQRLDLDGNLLYSHIYKPNGIEELPFQLGIIQHSCMENSYMQKTPHGIEICTWNSEGKVTQHEHNEETYKYFYDEEGKLVVDYTPQEGIYDIDGKLIQKGEFTYAYNEKEQLVQVTSDNLTAQFAYDQQNRRIYKKIETNEGIEEFAYLYLKDIPIAIFRNGSLEYLQIPLPPEQFSLTKYIAFETKKSIYIPIYCFPNHISNLIDSQTGEVIPFSIDPFGTNLDKQSEMTPFLFAGREYDRETGLIYFGHRFYDPSLQRWLTRDPLQQDDNHLYSYCFQNPLRYSDPDGRFVFMLAVPLGIEITAALLGKALLYGTAASGLAWLGAKGVQLTNDKLREKEIQKRIAEVEGKNIQGSGGSSSQFPKQNPLKKAPGNMQKQVERRQAPKSVARVQSPRVPYEKNHIDFKNKHSLNHDGTWKHNGRKLTNAEKEWIRINGWEIPPDQL